MIKFDLEFDSQLLCRTCYIHSGLFRNQEGEWRIDRQDLRPGSPLLRRNREGGWDISSSFFEDDTRFRRPPTASWGFTVPYYLKIKTETQLRNSIYYKLMDIVPGKDLTRQELTATLLRISTEILGDKSLTQLIYLMLNPVLLTHLVIENITDPGNTETKYQFPPPINMRGFSTLEELEIFDRTVYNIHTGERQSPPAWMVWRPRCVPLSEIELEVTINQNRNNTDTA